MHLASRLLALGLVALCGVPFMDYHALAVALCVLAGLCFVAFIYIEMKGSE
jgi:hypothetical protein